MTLILKFFFLMWPWRAPEGGADRSQLFICTKVSFSSCSVSCRCSSSSGGGGHERSEGAPQEESGERGGENHQRQVTLLGGNAAEVPHCSGTGKPPRSHCSHGNKTTRLTCFDERKWNEMKRKCYVEGKWQIRLNKSEDWMRLRERTRRLDYSDTR